MATSPTTWSTRVIWCRLEDFNLQNGTIEMQITLVAPPQTTDTDLKSRIVKVQITLVAGPRKHRHLLQSGRQPDHLSRTGSPESGRA